MTKKTPYRIRNWPAYNAALIGRGSLTLWVDEEAIRSWRYTGPPQRGAQYHYADTAIRCGLTLRAVYHLALRAAEGLAALNEVLDRFTEGHDTGDVRQAAALRDTLDRP